MSDNNIQDSFCQRKPDISYPCSWEYKVIGENQETLREAIMVACAPAAPEICVSNVSSSGKYSSLNATLVVENEEMRLTIFCQIQEHPSVKMVI